MIATEGKSHISFKIKVENSSVILGFLTTYENISPVNVWFDNEPNLKDSNLCEEDDTNLEKPNFSVVDPLGTDKVIIVVLLASGFLFEVSVYASRTFDDVPNGLTYIHVCLVPNEPCKFKILKLSIEGNYQELILITKAKLAKTQKGRHRKQEHKGEFK